MAIPRAVKKQDSAFRMARVPTSAPHNIVIPSTASVLRKPDDQAKLDHAVNQWGDFDAAASIDAQALKGGVVLEGTMSQVAVLNRELKALETRYFRTREQLDKVTERSDLLRAEMAKCRAQSDKSERDNAKLRNLLDRLQSDKKQLEQHAISNRDYAKKIEQRFFMGVPRGTHTQTLVQCNLEMTARVKALEKEVATRDEMIQSQLTELKAAQDNVAILKRALQTRFDELQLNGSLHNGVLFELARLQDQNASMALQLGEERKTSKALEAKLDHTRAQHIALEEHLVVRETWLASLESERVALGDKLASCENERQTFAFEKATLLKFIQEQAEAKFQAEAEWKRVQSAHMAEREASHTRLQAAMDDKQALQTTTNELLIKLEKSQLEYETLDKAYRAEQLTIDELRGRQHELFLDIQRLQDEYKSKDDEYRAAGAACRTLQAAVDTQQLEAQQLQSKIDELDAIIVALEQEIGQRKKEEAALRVAMENALRDLDTLSRQRNDAARAMNEAVVISASSLDEQQALENKVETQRAQLEQLKHAKSLLQHAMLEQLSALRRQLQTERLQRVEAEAKLKQLQRGGAAERSQSSLATPPGAALPSYVTPTPSYECDDLQPLPPPEISMPSPLPAHLAMLQRQSPPLTSRSSVSSSSSSSDSDEDRDTGTDGSPPRRAKSSLPRSEQTPERTKPSPSPSSSIPSPSDQLSLLELAGVI
jgi:DNA repair exonuclease SbcCD ATPase subunit